MPENRYNSPQTFATGVKNMKSVIKFQKDPESLAELFYRLLSNKEQTYHAKRKTTSGKLVIHSPQGSMRSVEDVYLIAKRLNPKIKAKTIFEAYITVSSLWSSNYCHTVGRMVHTNKTVWGYDANLLEIIKKLGDKNIKF